MEANAASMAKAGDTAKVVLALVASGKNPRDLGGVDLVAKLRGMVGSDGQIGTEAEFVNEHCYAMIALASAQQPMPQTAVDYLLSSQIEDGTWSWNGDTTAGGGDNNTAAMAVMALIAAGVPAGPRPDPKDAGPLSGQQNEDGGFPYINPSPYGTDSDANSTATVMWALLAAGAGPRRATTGSTRARTASRPWTSCAPFRTRAALSAGRTPCPTTTLPATVQAAVAVELKTLPFARWTRCVSIRAASRRR